MFLPKIKSPCLCPSVQNGSGVCCTMPRKTSCAFSPESSLQAHKGKRICHSSYLYKMGPNSEKGTVVDRQHFDADASFDFDADPDGSGSTLKQDCNNSF